MRIYKHFNFRQYPHVFCMTEVKNDHLSEELEIKIPVGFLKVELPGGLWGIECPTGEIATYFDLDYPDAPTIVLSNGEVITFEVVD